MCPEIELQLYSNGLITNIARNAAMATRYRLYPRIPFSVFPEPAKTADISLSFTLLRRRRQPAPSTAAGSFPRPPAASLQLRAQSTRRTPRTASGGRPHEVLGLAVRGRLGVRDHDLDRVLHSIPRVADRLREVLHVEGVRVDDRRVEPLLAHERLGAVRRRLALAADPVEVDVVAHQVRNVDRDLVGGERREADLAAAVQHLGGLVDRVRRPRALQHEVDALAPGQLTHRFDGVLVADVDHVVCAEALADLEPVVARAGQDDGLGAERLGNRRAEEPDRARAAHDDRVAGDQATELRQAVHGRAGGDDERRLLVAHGVVDGDQRVDVVDLVLAEAAVGGEAVGAVALVDVAVVLAVVVAGGVHALTAALALAAPRVDLHRDALPDLELVDARTEGHDRAHVLVAGREVLVEGQAALDLRRQPVLDDLQVGGADGDAVDAHEDLSALRRGNGLVDERQLARVIQDPCLHGVRNGKRRIHLHVVRLRHSGLSSVESESDADAESTPQRHRPRDAANRSRPLALGRGAAPVGGRPQASGSADDRRQPRRRRDSQRLRNPPESTGPLISAGLSYTEYADDR